MICFGLPEEVSAPHLFREIRPGLVRNEKRSWGFAHRFRPTYAGANMGHPYGVVDPRQASGGDLWGTRLLVPGWSPKRCLVDNEAHMSVTTPFSRRRFLGWTSSVAAALGAAPLISSAGAL